MLENEPLSWRRGTRPEEQSGVPDAFKTRWSVRKPVNPGVQHAVADLQNLIASVPSWRRQDKPPEIDEDMSRGRGRGRGRGGFGFDAGSHGGLGFEMQQLRQLTAESSQASRWQGKGRGGFANGNNSGTSTPGSDTGRGGFRGRGRGQGRGRGRGGAHSMRNQNAVGFDYGSISSKARVHDPDYSTADQGDDEGDDGDAIIQPHKSYKHTIRPHLEDGQTSPLASSGSISPQRYLPPGARSSSTLAELERAQRIQTGQVASLIPTGPKAAQVHRFYGTENALKKGSMPKPYRTLDDIENVAPQGNVPTQKSRFKIERPPPDPFEDACLGGIPRGMRNRPSKEQFPSYPKASMAAPSFIRAEGEWRDGVWYRASDGKPGLPGLETGEPFPRPQQTRDAFDKASEGAGLGFSKAADSDAQKGAAQSAAPGDAPSSSAFDLDAAMLQLQDGGSKDADSIDALLQAFPGSSMVQEGDALDSSWGYYKPDSGFQPSSSSSMNKLYVRAPTRDTVDSAEDDEVILVSDRASKSSMEPIEVEEDDVSKTFFTAPGDANIEEQGPREPASDLQAFAAGEQASAAVEEAGSEPAQDSFVVDRQGEPSADEDFVIDTAGVNDAQASATSERIAYDVIDGQVVGERREIEQSQVEPVEPFSDDDINVQDTKPKGKKGRNAAKKARRRARGGKEQEPAIPREGDSDLDWGSDGPPPVQFKEEEAEQMFTLDQLRLAETPRDADDEESFLAIALAKSVADSERAQQPSKKSHKDLLLEDYMANAMSTSDNEEGNAMQTEERDDAREHEPTELDSMISFMNSMDGQRKGREITMEDVATERRIEQEDEDDWETESEEGNEETASGSESDSDADADKAIEREERRALDGEAVASEDSSDEDDDEDSDDDDSTDEEDERFEKSFTWADEDEDFISRIEKFASANMGALKGRNRAVRNKLFKAIESGDFAGIEGGLPGGVEDVDLANDPIFANQTAPKGKQARKKKWKDDDLWAAELQAQWEKDRSKKADNKRKRAEQRALAADSPFHNTNGSKGKPGGKKAAKKAARAERRMQQQVEAGVVGRSRYDPDDTPASAATVDVLKHHARSIVDVNDQIQAFLADYGKSTLSMPPMDKHARAQVHDLAKAYGLKSLSQGSGSKRFTVLTKTSRSGLDVKQGKVNRIVRQATGSLGINGKGPNRVGGGAGKSGGRGEKAGPVPRNVEGSAVGFGAERIGEDNIGHRLLSAMGWTEGSGVGATRGMSDPVGATIKINRGGLGF